MGEINGVLDDSVLDALSEAFGRKARLEGSVLAPILGVSTKMLVRAGNDGKIDYSLKGTKARMYTREAVEDYLRAKACPSTSRSAKTVRRKARSSITRSRSRSPGGRASSPARLAKERADLLKRWKAESERKPPSV